MRFSLLYFLLFILFWVDVRAQEKYSSVRVKKWVLNDARKLTFDTLSIVPGSFELFQNQQKVPESAYILNTEFSSFQPVQPGLLNDTLYAYYKVFPFSFTKPYTHKLEERYIQPRESKNPFAYEVNNQQESIFSSTDLNKQGSISRGISFGNSQNLSVSSNLNLQLSGKISDEISILAAITDDNIPIQPEGNTKQLQDFDQVYIQLFNKNHKLIGGDFQLSERNSYFMRYFKKAQGISYQLTQPLLNDTTKLLKMRISGAASRGKFARQTIKQQEGQQGPYRLAGAENETFIIILSGTEKVYIDGELLVRGQENDYIIDYNNAEITFTPRRLITKDRRIIVEFQYSDRNYVRTLADFSTEYVSENTSLHFKFFTEQDHKNQPINEVLNTNKKLFLYNLGDSLQNGLFPSTDSVAFNENKVLYRKTDSLGYVVYVYSSNPNDAYYSATFSNVGEGNGFYVQSQSTANGRVFTWVAPDTVGGTLIKKGNFEPVQLLITPKQRQMLSLGMSQKVKSFDFFAETALSKNDLNTFSDKDRGDDYGTATRIRINHKNEENPAGFFFKQSGSFELIQKNFREIEWFRSAEFLRDWNLSSTKLIGDQHILNGTFGSYHKRAGKLFEYNVDYYTAKDSEWQGLKNFITNDFRWKKWTVLANSSVLKSTLKQESSFFIRNKSVISYQLSKAWQVGIKDDIERNMFNFSKSSTDSLLLKSYQFIEYELFVGRKDTLNNNIYLSYVQRHDKMPFLNQLRNFTKADHVNLSYDLFNNSAFSLKGKSTYRNLKVLNPTLSTSVRPEETFLNRIEYALRPWKGALTASSFYELGSGFESRKEYSYVEVTPGKGNFTWIDYNNNGVKELNEFETAVFSDQATYIKVFTPTNQYIQTKNNQFSQTVFLKPEVLLKNKKTWYSFIKIFSDQFSYKLDWKTTEKSYIKTFNPFGVSFADTSLLAVNKLFRNSFYVLRTDPVFGLTVNYQNTTTKFLSNNGSELRNQKFTEGIARWNIYVKFLLELKAAKGIRQSENEFFNTRNFFINYYDVSPKITFQPTNQFRTNLSYSLVHKQNNADLGGETSINKALKAEARWSKASKTNIEASFGYILINYYRQDGAEASENSTIGFEMLEGFKTGQNYTWAASFIKTLSNNLQITLQYNGRKSEGSKMVHIGTAEIRAFF